jgi:hypothetical protein
MKGRITLTIDPTVARRARKVARARNTTVSGLVEDLLRAATIPGGEKQGRFVDRWAGRFVVPETTEGDDRMAALKAKYGLDSR